MDYKQFALSVHEAQNRLRKDPQSFIPILEARLKYFEGSLYKAPGKIPLRTNEGPAAVKECIEVLRKTKPLGEMAFDPNLAKACTDHVNDIGPKGVTGHNGSDGSRPFDRIKRYGAYNSVGENIDFGSTSGEEVIISLIVDDGVSSRGHRTNMLNADYDITGVACGVHQGYQHCTVIVYSRKGKGSGQNGNSGSMTNFNKEYTDLQQHFSKPFGEDFNGKQKMNEMKIETSSHGEKGAQIIKTSEKTAIRTVNGVTTKTVYKTVWYSDGSKKEEVQEINESGESPSKPAKNLVEEWKMQEAQKNEQVKEPVQEAPKKVKKEKSGCFFMCGSGGSKKKSKYEAKV